MSRSRRTILKLHSLEARDVPSGNRLFATGEDFGGSLVTVYEATGPVTPDGKLPYGPNDLIINTGGQSFDGSGKVLATFEPFPGFHGGVHVAVGDVTGDGVEDVVVGAGKGGGAHVKVYYGADLLKGQVRVASEFFAFDSSFRGGVFVAVGQFDPQFPALEIAVGAGEGGGPHVKIFGLSQVIYALAPGTPTPPPYFFAQLQNGFFAFDAGFRGGVRVAAGDVTGDGKAELIAAAGPGGGPHVRVFDVNPPNPLAIYPYAFKAIDGFFAFDASFRGGVYVAAGELDGNPATAEVVVGAGEGGGPHVKVYGVGTNGKLNLRTQTFVGGPDDHGGVRVGIGNLSKLTDRQSIYIGRGPLDIVTLAASTFAVPYADLRLSGFTLNSNQLQLNSLYLPITLGDYQHKALVVSV